MYYNYFEGKNYEFITTKKSFIILTAAIIFDFSSRFTSLLAWQYSPHVSKKHTHLVHIFFKIEFLFSWDFSSNLVLNYFTICMIPHLPTLATFAHPSGTGRACFLISNTVLWSEGHIASCSGGHFWGFHRVSEVSKASLGVNDPPENISNH